MTRIDCCVRCIFKEIDVLYLLMVISSIGLVCIICQSGLMAESNFHGSIGLYISGNRLRLVTCRRFVGFFEGKLVAQIVR